MTKDIQNFTAYSISFEKANAKIRGEFSFFPNQVKAFAEEINAQNLGATFIVSTCNRTELYAHTEHPEKIAEIFAQYVEVSLEDFYTYAEIFEGKEALNHLFRVSSGLESQILGDFEIVGQLKTWARRFQKNKALSSFLIKSVDTALQISKKIKSETLISNGTASVSFAAVNYLMNSPEKIDSVLLVGTGKIGINTAKNLVKHLPNVQFRVVNRTPEKAENLAEKLNIEYGDFQNLKEEIAKADAVIVSTNSDQPIINPSHFAQAASKNVLDLSIPNNVDTEVSELENIQLLNVDDLAQLVDETLEKRAAEIPKAEKIIEVQTEAFEDWLEKRKHAPIIKNFKNQLDIFNEVHSHELRKKNVNINGKETLLADKLAQKMTNRLADYILENPELAEETAELIQKIFQLDKE